MKKEFKSMVAVLMIAIATILGTTACRHSCNKGGKCDKEMCSGCKKCGAKDCGKDDSCCMKGEKKECCKDMKGGMSDSMHMSGMEGKKACCKDEKK